MRWERPWLSGSGRSALMQQPMVGKLCTVCRKRAVRCEKRSGDVEVRAALAWGGVRR